MVTKPIRTLRHTLRGALVSGILVNVASAGCFYTDTINEAPVPGIRNYTAGPFFVGDTIQLDATKTSDDGPSNLDLVATWSAFSCETECIQFAQLASAPVDTQFSFEIPDHRRVEVQLRVRDVHGATRIQPDILRIDVGNRAPQFSLQVVGSEDPIDGSYILSRPIKIFAVPPDDIGGFDADGDEVQLTWELIAPSGSDPQARSFSPLDDRSYELVGDVGGQWSVKVTATDSLGEKTELRRDLFIGLDRPPCLQSADPQPSDTGAYLVRTQDGPRRFSVLRVADALDPFPALEEDGEIIGQTSFLWSVREPGETEFLPQGAESESSFVIDPAHYAPGSQLDLRVEVRDRVEGPERVLLCDPEVASCELESGTGCFQRRTWGVTIQ